MDWEIAREQRGTAKREEEKKSREEEKMEKRGEMMLPSRAFHGTRRC